MKPADSGNIPPVPAPPQSGKNHLSGEKSPYLRQHADDPVAWYPWGDEAFAVAGAEDRPVFLSIGYSTCHWCHVMAGESFRDPEVARVLNNSYVCIKVDREERPDIDRVYMAVCRMMTGTGGWPLSIFLTPEKTPFYTATYIPRDGRFGSPGILDLLRKIARLWKERRSDLTGSADRISAALREFFRAGEGTKDPDPGLLAEAYEDLVLRFDSEYGGFDHAPKFPMPSLLLFLLRYWKRTGTERALAMVKATLDGIRYGGIYDHIGGGIHRYSTDARWRIPHFEKMLYDQALLALAFTEAYQATGAPRYRETAEDILAYMLRDLRSPEGGFFAAEDADSPGGEGAFYRFDNQELEGVLGKGDAAIAQAVFNVPDMPGGDRYDGPGPGTVLHRTGLTADLAGKFGLSLAELEGRVTAIRAALLHARDLRPRPSRDEKVLADMNGLAVAALARAAQVFSREEYRAAAEEAAAFVLGRMRMPDKGIFHRYCCGEAAVPGFAQDYAGMVFGLLELYEAAFDDRYLDAAHDLTGYLLRHFQDDKDGGFFDTSDSAERVLVRTKEVHDGVVPSANALILISLLRLSHLSGTVAFEETAQKMLRTFGTDLETAPSGHAFFLCGLDYATGNPVDVVIAGSRGDPAVHAMVEKCRTGFSPWLLVRLASAPVERMRSLAATPDGSTEYPAPGTGAAAYVCANRACQPPVTDPERLSGLLASVQGIRKTS